MMIRGFEVIGGRCLALSFGISPPCSCVYMVLFQMIVLS